MRRSRKRLWAICNTEVSYSEFYFANNELSLRKVNSNARQILQEYAHFSLSYLTLLTTFSLVQISTDEYNFIIQSVNNIKH